MVGIAKITIVNQQYFSALAFFWRAAATTRDAFVPVRPARQAAPSNRGIDQLLSISVVKSTGLLRIIDHVYTFSHLRSAVLLATECTALRRRQWPRPADR